MSFCGIVLAAGAGTRFGGPKGLARTPDGEPWVARAVRTLRAGGCTDVLVVVGAEAERVAALVPRDASVVRADDWATGLSASIRAGLEAASATRADAVMIVPVDTPDLPVSVLERVCSAGPFAQAVFEGRPGHPALIPREHWAAVAAAVTGDRGARRQLVALGVVDVECADLFSGADIDTR